MTRQEQIYQAINELIRQKINEMYSGAIIINMTNGSISNKISFKNSDKLVVDFSED